VLFTPNPQLPVGYGFGIHHIAYLSFRCSVERNFFTGQAVWLCKHACLFGTEDYLWNINRTVQEETQDEKVASFCRAGHFKAVADANAGCLVTVKFHLIHLSSLAIVQSGRASFNPAALG
jgi:hypothetical protein